MRVTKVWKSGNSFVITVPREVLEETHIRAGDIVQLDGLDIHKFGVRKMSFNKMAKSNANGRKKDE